MIEWKCETCGEVYPADYFAANSKACLFCAQKERFAAFARECGLDAFPDPAGERYVYHLDGDCAGKKSECVHLIDDLWDALVRAKGADKSLLLGKE